MSGRAVPQPGRAAAGAWPSDPGIRIPIGPEAEAAGDWTVSLGEIDALGRKAARGAGFSWGMAEEAGFSARWLAAHGLPGPEALAALLGAIDGRVVEHAARPGEGGWHAPSGVLCPICLGTALSDDAARLAAGVTTAPVLVSPLVLAPLAAAARDLGAAFAVAGGGGRLVVMPDGPAGDLDALSIERVEALSIAASTGAGTAPWPAMARARRVAVETWRALDAFAQRTYAPATEASRRAGAGGTDDD